MHQGCRHSLELLAPKPQNPDPFMIILSSDMQLSALDYRQTSFRGSASTGEQDVHDRSRSDSFTQGTTGFASTDMLEEAVTPSHLPELGDALKNLYAGRIRRDISSSHMGTKLMLNSTQLAERVLRFTLNQ